MPVLVIRLPLFALFSVFSVFSGQLRSTRAAHEEYTGKGKEHSREKTQKAHKNNLVCASCAFSRLFLSTILCTPQQ